MEISIGLIRGEEETLERRFMEGQKRGSGDEGTDNDDEDNSLFIKAVNEEVDEARSEISSRSYLTSGVFAPIVGVIDSCE